MEAVCIKRIISLRVENLDDYLLIRYAISIIVLCYEKMINTSKKKIDKNKKKSWIAGEGIGNN